MTRDLPFDIVELVPCPTPASTGNATIPLRELAFRADAWLPNEIAALRTRFAADEEIAAIAGDLDRPVAGVRSKVAELGLRRNSLRAWTEGERAFLARHYGADAASTIAAALGRTPAAIYAQAGVQGLTEGNPSPYTDWKIAQIRAGYAQGVPVAQLAVLIGRLVSGIASIASRLGIGHANAPPDWTAAEQHRALQMAEEGMRYRRIATDLGTEGSPRADTTPSAKPCAPSAMGGDGAGPGWKRRRRCCAWPTSVATASRRFGTASAGAPGRSTGRLTR